MSDARSQVSPDFWRKRRTHGASGNTPTTSSNCALSRCQPIPAPGRYSVISTWRKVSAGRSNIATILTRRETRNDRNGEASTEREVGKLTHKRALFIGGEDVRTIAKTLR